MLLLRPLRLRVVERLLDFREENLRAPALRPDEDFLPPPRREDFPAPRAGLRAPPELPLLDRFRALPLRPPLLRPEDPDRDLFRLPLRLLDFLAAAIGKLRVGGSVERIARFAHNSAGGAV